jgi:hypothetical protein
MGENRGAFRGCGGESEERVPLGTPGCIMEDNIRKAFSRNRMGWREVD